MSFETWPQEQVRRARDKVDRAVSELALAEAELNRALALLKLSELREEG